MKKMLLTAALLASFGGLAYAHQGAGSDLNMPMAGAAGEMVPSMNFSAEQRQQMAKIMQENRPSREKMQKFRQNMQQLRDEERQLMNAPTLDPKALDALADKRAQLFKQMYARRMKIRHEIWQTLTPEQRKNAGFQHFQMPRFHGGMMHNLPGAQ